MTSLIFNCFVCMYHCIILYYIYIVSFLFFLLFDRIGCIEHMIGGTNSTLVPPITACILHFRISEFHYCSQLFIFVVVGMESGIVRCKECSKQFDTRQNVKNSLIKHIVSFNHIVYTVTPTDEEKEKTLCCCYCGNVNIIVLGFS